VAESSIGRVLQTLSLIDINTYQTDLQGGIPSQSNQMSSTTVEGNHQVASFLYLEPDPRHEKEKPYKLRYEPGEGIPRSNVSNEKQDGIVVRDVRNEEQESLAERGYTWVNLQSALSPDEFYDETKVKEIYYAELRGLLQKLLNPKRIEILEHNVCCTSMTKARAH